MTLDLSKTQAHVDPLIGTTVGGYAVISRAGAGRFGTLYRAEDAAGAAVTLQVLRTELVGNEHETSAASALNCAAVAKVLGAAVLPDGRHVRVMELLDGRSLDEDLVVRGAFSVADTITVLSQLLKALQTTHAWQVAHGRLGPSSVLRVAGQLKLIDFGLANGAVTPADDLKAVGALGFALLKGHEVDAPPPTRAERVPERLHWLLRELWEGRVTSPSVASRELEWLRPTTAKSAGWRLAFAALICALAAAGWWLWTTRADAPRPEPVAAAVEPPTPAPAAEEDSGVAVVDAPEPPDAGLVEAPSVKEPPRKKQRTTEKPPAKSAAPTVVALKSQLRVLDTRLHQRRLPAGEKEEALHALNKLRLRLSGAVTEDDRRDIAARLDAWKRSWLP